MLGKNRKDQTQNKADLLAMDNVKNIKGEGIVPIISQSDHSFGPISLIYINLLFSSKSICFSKVQIFIEMN